MNLIIKGIHAAGDLAHERVVLEATADTDAGSYIIFVTEKSATRENAVQGGVIPHSYWIPDRNLKKGDIVVVYTKGGRPSSKVNASGSTSYFFYWFQKTPLWSDDKNVVLISIDDWGWLPVAADEITDVSSTPLSRPTAVQPSTSETATP